MGGPQRAAAEVRRVIIDHFGIRAGSDPPRHPMRHRVGAVRLLLVAAIVVPVLSACGNPTQAVQNCVGTSDTVTRAIQQGMKPEARATLRNARSVQVPGSNTTFVSAELHLDSDSAHDKGDIATWATNDVASGDGFLSVDVHAREDSTWPHAPFGVTKNGAIESRACASLNTGKTKAQIDCEQRKNSGNNVALPDGKDCSDL